jgi:HopA1 effector protein family
LFVAFNSVKMPLLNSIDPSLDASAVKVLDTLEDIINHVQILPNFDFSHPSHLPLALEPEIFVSLQQLSPQLQDKYLRWRLGCYLLSLYEAGSGKTQFDSKAKEAASLPIQDEPAQNMALGVHSSFYERLHTHNVGTGYFDPGWRVLRQSKDGLFAVQKNGLTLHVSRERHLQPSDEPVTIGDEVAVHLPSNQIQQGCYAALGNVGPVDPTQGQIVNVYFNLPSEGFGLLMGALTTALNALKMPFVFKVPYNPEDCDRPDAGVLCLYKTHYATAYPVLQTLYQSLQPSFRPEVPLFTKRLAPGLALAEQPIAVITPQESFGLHRFQAIAQGLIVGWRQNLPPTATMESVLQSFTEHHIDPSHPYLNVGAEDCYTLLVYEADAIASSSPLGVKADVLS